jgi:hypothetical protein
LQLDSFGLRPLAPCLPKRALTLIGKTLGKKALKEGTQIVKPDTSHAKGPLRCEAHGWHYTG